MISYLLFMSSYFYTADTSLKILFWEQNLTV